MRRFICVPVALLLACSGGLGDPCVTDSECFHGEVCNDGYCGSPTLRIDAGNGGEPDDGTAADQGGQSDTSPSADTGTTSDSATPGDIGPGDPDLGTQADGGPIACIADPFDVCVDDENSSNNSFPGVAFVPMTRGCQPSGFVPLDETVTGRQCALDPEDQYYITVVECDIDEPGMIIEATLDVKDDCDPALIFFDVESIGTSCATPNPDSDKQLRCETLATGERRISVIWPGSNVPTVGSIRFSIQTPDRQDVQFDYDLRVVIREP